MAVSAYETELSPDLEGDGFYESEWAAESEADLESEEFFGWLRRQAQALRTPGTWQRRAALGAARGAMTAGAGLIGTAIGGPIGAAIGAPIGASLAGAIGPERELDGEIGLELDGEAGLEMDAELSPIRRAYPDALMEHMGHEAVQAESEEEAAEAFLPLIPMAAARLLPMAGRALPRVAPSLARVTPHLVRGVSNVARTLFRSPRARPLLRAVPTVARRAVTDLARQAAQGQIVTPRAALRTLARRTAGVIGSPQQVLQAWQRSRALDHRFHRAGGPGTPALR